MMQLNNLPDTVIINICCFLEPIDLISFINASQVPKRKYSNYLIALSREYPQKTLSARWGTWDRFFRYIYRHYSDDMIVDYLLFTNNLVQNNKKALEAWKEGLKTMINTYENMVKKGCSNEQKDKYRTLMSVHLYYKAKKLGLTPINNPLLL